MFLLVTCIVLSDSGMFPPPAESQRLSDDRTDDRTDDVLEAYRQCEQKKQLQSWNQMLTREKEE